MLRYDKLAGKKTNPGMRLTSGLILYAADREANRETNVNARFTLHLTVDHTVKRTPR
jgi:ADP-ribose pyrophosphatase YjhB (NUDIX family)